MSESVHVYSTNGKRIKQVIIKKQGRKKIYFIQLLQVHIIPHWNKIVKQDI